VLTIARGGARDPAMQAVPVNGSGGYGYNSVGRRLAFSFGCYRHLGYGEEIRELIAKNRFPTRCGFEAVPYTEMAIRRTKQLGFTLIELIAATTILLVLSGLIIPVARVQIKREKEHRLRAGLWEMRDAIDRYKDAADRGAFQIKVGSEGYPPDLDTLVNGVDVGGKKLRFLRHIPIDPMTDSTEWGLRAMQDDPTSDSWNGENVFDVYTKSQGTALEGTKYKDW